MEVISIDGIEYVKATQLAKRLKYTTDYIGQLCRAGKVKAKLVGRTWYVNPESIAEHKNTRYTKSSEDEKTSSASSIIKISPKRVESVPRRNNFFQGGYNQSSNGNVNNNGQNSGRNFLNHVAWKPAKYEPDTADLYPSIKPPESSQKINVELAGASEVKISGHDKVSNFKTEPLPEVALRGKVKITSFNDTLDNSDENIARTEFFNEDNEEFESLGEEVKDVRDKNSVKIGKSEKRDEEQEAVLESRPKAQTQTQTKTQAQTQTKVKRKEPYSYPVEIQRGESVFANLPSRPVVFAQSTQSRATMGNMGTVSEKFVNSVGQNDQREKVLRIGGLEDEEEVKTTSWLLPGIILGLGLLLMLTLALIEKNIFASASDYSTNYSLNFSPTDFSLD